MKDFIKFRDNFFKLWYKVAPHTIVYIDYDNLSRIITIRLEFMSIGNKINIFRRYYFENVGYYDIVESLLSVYNYEDLHRRAVYNDK